MFSFINIHQERDVPSLKTYLHNINFLPKTISMFTTLKLMTQKGLAQVVEEKIYMEDRDRVRGLINSNRQYLKS